MWTRLTTFVLGLFWVTMLGMLCWSEFGGNRHLGTGASMETVWEKILTSPDTSALDVRIQNTSVGYCRWAPTIIEGGAASTGSEDAKNLEGMVRKVIGYNLELTSSFNLVEDSERMRVNVTVDFNPDRTWSDLKIEFRNAEHSLEVISSASERNLSWTADGETMRLTYDQLQDPTKLLGRFGGPLAAMALASNPFIPKGTDATRLASNIQWEANYGWIRVLNQKVRCYELHTKVLNRDIKVFVSLVGEILQIQLPNGIELVNTTETQM